MTFEAAGRDPRVGSVAARSVATNRKIVLLGVVFLTVAGLLFAALLWLPRRPIVSAPPPQNTQRSSPAQAAESPCANATTIRNATGRMITYTICPGDCTKGLQVRRIAPSEVDCFPTVVPLEIEFHNGENAVTYSLDPGRPYSFRYDEGSKIGIFWGSHGRTDVVDLAPYVPTPRVVVDKMLELAGVTANDVVYDIGCGDGRIVIAAARKYGAHGVGIDLDKVRIDESLDNARRAGIERLVKFICMDATRADVSEATVVTLYLISESNALLRPMLEKQLRPGSRVVSHNYRIAGWENKQVVAASMKDEEGKDHSIYVYSR